MVPDLPVLRASCIDGRVQGLCEQMVWRDVDRTWRDVGICMCGESWLVLSLSLSPCGVFDDGVRYWMLSARATDGSVSEA